MLMATNLREAVRQAADDLPETYLADVLRLMQLLTDTQNHPDIEPEELWLLASGQLKHMVDEIDDAPPPIDDWRKHLHDL
jgi:hypothetical protein